LFSSELHTFIYNGILFSLSFVYKPIVCPKWDRARRHCIRGERVIAV
jgi:hypothetical protein